MRNRTGLGMRSAAIAICWLVTAIGAQAATRTWNGAGTNELAGNPTNWAGGVAPAAGDDIVLDATTNKNMTWDAAAPSNVASWYQVGYAGTVTIATVYGTTGFTNFMIAGNCVISNGAWAHANNTSSEANRLAVTVGGDFNVAPGGKIDVSGLGYDINQGPGKAGTFNGAGHGGQGGWYNVIGPTYGSLVAPTNLGSGGGGLGQGKGGGAARVIVQGATTLNGAIAADGKGDAADMAGGGSGGSIYLVTGTLAGNGVISARGGNCTVVTSGGGAGGRIAALATNGTDLGSVIMRAEGGTGANAQGGASGTIYTKLRDQTYGSLLVDNSNLVTAARTIMTNGAWQFDAIITSNRGLLMIASNAVLDLSVGTALSSDSATLNIKSGVVISDGTILFPESFTLDGTIMQRGIGSISLTNITIVDGGILTHEANASAESNKLNLIVNGNLTINAGGLIDVGSQGYAAGQGPGSGGSYSGAGHGGEGGLWILFGATYGSILTPTNCGSGGGGAGACGGGGAVRIEVQGATTNNGAIAADGEGSSADMGAGGAGGSIYLVTGTLAGNGVISAHGGYCTVATAGGGGGGRITVVVTDGADFGSVGMRADGGSGAQAQPGAAGTIYRQTASQAAGKGIVTIDNSNVTTTARTPIPAVTNAVPDEIVNAMIVVTNRTAVISTTNVVIGELLIYTNCFWTLTNWTVSVKQLEHSLEDATQRGPGATNRVDHYDQILWIGSPPRTVFMVH